MTKLYKFLAEFMQAGDKILRYGYTYILVLFGTERIATEMEGIYWCAY
jgi:hypothetical protein